MEQLITIALRTVLTPLEWFATILTQSGFLGLFLGLFAATMVTRLFLAPIIGNKSNGGGD